MREPDVKIWEHRGHEGQKTEEGGRNGTCVGCEHVAGDKNSKDRRIRHILLGSVPTTHL
jgi:hypothetical protein